VKSCSSQYIGIKIGNSCFSYGKLPENYICMHVCVGNGWICIHIYRDLSFDTANVLVKENWRHVVHLLRRAYGASYDTNPVIL